MTIASASDSWPRPRSPPPSSTRMWCRSTMPESSRIGVLWAHLQEEPPSPPGYTQLGPVFGRALAKEPEACYATCAQLAEAAADALGLAGRRRSRKPVAAVLALALVAVGVGIWALVQGNGSNGGSRTRSATGRPESSISRPMPTSPLLLSARMAERLPPAPTGQTMGVHLWDIQSRKQLAVLRGHNGFVFGVAFGPDGRTLASAGNDTVRLWDTSSYQQLAVLPGGGQLNDVAYSPDGRSRSPRPHEKDLAARRELRRLPAPQAPSTVSRAATTTLSCSGRESSGGTSPTSSSRFAASSSAT